MHLIIDSEIARLKEIARKQSDQTTVKTRDARTQYKEEEIRKLSSYHLALVSDLKEATVGQRIRLQVRLLPTSSDRDSFKIAANQSEIHCFISADGLQVRGSEVAVMTLAQHTSEVPTARFELEAHLCGERTYTVELFAEDPQSGRMHIYKTLGQITVSPPTIFEGPSPMLKPLEIQIAARPDFTLRAITEFPDGKDSSRCVTYHLASRLPGLWRGEKPVGRITLSEADMAQMHGLLNQVLHIVSSSQPEDARARVLALGDYLFNRLFPVEETAPFHEALRKAAGRLHTWLIVDDSVTWLPWELLAHDWLGTGQPQFLGEQFRISRWIAGLGPKPYSEIPLGEIALAHYRLQETGQEATDEVVEQQFPEVAL